MHHVNGKDLQQCLSDPLKVGNKHDKWATLGWSPEQKHGSTDVNDVLFCTCLK